MKAARTILSFMRKTKHTRKAIYLDSICPDASVCLAFGRHADDIKAHFKNFLFFDYVNKNAPQPIRSLGEASINGFIKEIAYIHRGYQAHAILKSSQTPEADNLMYEYMVGQYINKLNKQYPCFLETYGHYVYTDENAWAKMRDENSMEVLKKELLLQTKTDFDDACRNSKLLAILIQSLKGVKSLSALYNKPDFVASNLLTTLFQIYMPLAMVKDTFTHYDLHLDNIQIYEPTQDHYIHFHYHLPSGHVVSFKSGFIAKIIDYGRSYFNDIASGVNSADIYTDLCDAYECRNDMDDEEDEGCGEMKGFGWMKDDDNPHHISSQKRNISHDLLPLARLKESKSLALLASPPLKALLAIVNYKALDSKTAREMGSAYFGTPEILTKKSARKINNVYDAFEYLAMLLLSEPQIRQNDLYYADPAKKKGDLEIYSDGRGMKFKSGGHPPATQAQTPAMG